MNEPKPRPAPETIDETLDLLTGADYVADRSLATVLFLSLRMKRPLFLEGEAGVGKTEIAKVLAQSLGRRLIRLQCYEGPRRLLRRLRMELCGADDRDPHGGGCRQGRPQGHGEERLLRTLPDPPSGARCADRQGRRRAGVPHRRTRPHRRGLRGVPARNPLRLPGDGAGARHDQGGGAADRHHHHQPHARDPRRAEAPLPLPLGRLSRCRARAGDRPAQGARGQQAAVGGGRELHPEAARRSSCSRCRASPRPSTGRAR